MPEITGKKSHCMEKWLIDYLSAVVFTF